MTTDYFRKQDLINRLKSKPSGLYELEDIEEALDTLGPAHVSPDKYGKWIHKINYDPYDDRYYGCTKCRFTLFLEAGNPKDNYMHYCPNCGAKMDEYDDWEEKH